MCRLLACLTIGFLLGVSVPKVKATHIMGGDIYWECLGGNNYVFYMSIYRDCSDPWPLLYYQYIPPATALSLPTPILDANGQLIPLASFGLDVHNYPGLPFIQMFLLSNTQDPGPDCAIGGPSATCAAGSPGSYEEFVFKSNIITLSGTPPPQGWIFSYSDCCRNTVISNLVAPGALGFTLRAIMYALPSNASNSCDNSPKFNLPVNILCLSPLGLPPVPFSFTQSAEDADADSLWYSFGEPLDEWVSGPFTSSNPPPLLFNPTYSASSPFPSVNTLGFIGSQAATIDGYTGQINGMVTQPGYFVSVIRVQSYRCGQLIAEVFRELQLIANYCAPNVTPSQNNVLGIVDPIPTDGIIQQTVPAGTLVNFEIFFEDLDPGQTFTISAGTGPFGDLFTSSNTGCNFPPCATLDPPPPISSINQPSILFNWQTSCDHAMGQVIPTIIDASALCNTQPVTEFYYQLAVSDNACPFPATYDLTININVEAPPLTPSPELRCLEVMQGTNGDVKLTWIPPPDPNNQFAAYHVFRSSNFVGPYVQIATLTNLSQNTYTDLAAGADAAQVYYYISTLTGCAGNILNTPLDTLATMYLEITNVTPAGIISIDWNEPVVPLLPSSILPYSLFKTVDNTLPSFSAMPTPPATSQASDIVSGCNQQVGYYVVLADLLGCSSVSNVDSGTFSTTAPPLPPTLDSVSVIGASNDVIVSWNLGTNPLDDSLYIFKWDGSAWIKRDSANHVTESSKILYGDSPELVSIRYRLEAKDKCKVRSAPTAEHNTIWLNYSIDNCQALANLTYTPYAAWLGSNLIYRVFVSENSSPFQLSQSVNASAGISPNLAVPNLIQGSNYCVYIQLLNPITNQSSSSNLVCFNANVEIPPDYTYLRTASVEASGSVYSACLIDPNANISSYALLRSVWPGNAFDTLNAFPVLPGTNEVVFSDATALSNEQSYTYKYVMYNKCYEVAGVSNLSRTMLLQGKADDGFVNKLYWNTYDEWDGQVFEYKVFRSLGNNFVFEEVFNAVTDTVFIDRVADEVDRELTFCYLIKAFEGPGNIYGIRDSSYSNVLCLTQKPTIYFPSAFTPGSNDANATYKPRGLYETLATNLKFAIYNRWGEEVFYTEDLSKGWDGTYKFGPVPADIYAVRVTFELPDGTEFKHTGSVLVLY